jgi:hypothetical protein
MIERLIEDAVKDEAGGVLVESPPARGAVFVRAEPYLPRLVYRFREGFRAGTAPLGNGGMRYERGGGVDGELRGPIQ